MRTHEKERRKVVCSVKKCGKTYTDTKAWMVHFNNCHKEKNVNIFKNKLKSVTVVNAVANQTDVNQLVKLMDENKKLKEQLRKILKVRIAARLRKRSIKQTKISSKTKQQNVSNFAIMDCKESQAEFESYQSPHLNAIR